MNAGTKSIAPEDLRYLLPEGGQFFVIRCSVLMEPLSDPLKCLELSRDKANNKRCVKYNCISPFKVCPTCITHNELSKIGLKGPIFCEKKANLCGDHKKWGETAHRSESERVKSVTEYEEARDYELLRRDEEIEKRSITVPEKKFPEEKVASVKTPAGKEKGPAEIKVTEEGGKTERLNLLKDSQVRINGAKPAVIVVDAAEKVPATAPLEPVEESLPESIVAPPVPETDIAASASLEEKEGGLVAKNSEVDPVKEGEVITDFFHVRRRDISPYMKQPRKYFNLSKLKHLAACIKEEGQLMPVLLRKLEEGGEYKWELVEGERRYKACGMIGKEWMKAVSIDVADEKDQFKKSVIANFCREGHTHLETAQAICRIMKDYEYNESRIAKIIGKSVTYVSQHLLLLKLHPDIQEMLNEDASGKQKLPYTVATYVAQATKDHEFQLVLVNEILEQKLKTTQAYAHIRQRLLEKGLQLPQKKRNPRDDYRVFIGFVKRSVFGLGNFSSRSRESFESMLTFRPVEDRQGTIDELEKVIQEARRLQEKISAMKQS